MATISAGTTTTIVVDYDDVVTFDGRANIVTTPSGGSTIYSTLTGRQTLGPYKVASTAIVVTAVGDCSYTVANDLRLGLTVPTAVAVSRSLTAADNGATLDVSDTVALTVPAGLPTDFGCAIIPTGTITIVSGGGTLLNGATTTLSRAASSNSIFAIVHRATTADSYIVNGS
jgi:hypothetical protein